jgi:hypothetical protein
MCKERVVFLIAGVLVTAGAVLGAALNPWWLLLSGFVGVNMLQAALTGFCPLTKVLNALRVNSCGATGPTA